MLAQTGPIRAVIRGAADSESFAVELRRRLLQERLANMTAMIRRYFGDSLRPGLAIDEAGERAAAVANTELQHLLIARIG